MRYSELKQEKDIGLFAIKLDDGFLLANDSEETIIFESAKIAQDYIEENFLDGSEVVETSVEDISERELTDAESAKKERIVKKLKKHKGEFTDRYGDDGESVMYAVATKRAKMHEDTEDLTEDDVLGLRGLVAPGAPGGHTRGTGAYFGGVKPQKKTIQRKTAELKDRIRSTLGTHKGFKEDMDLDEGVDHDMKWLKGEYKKIESHPTMTASEKSDAYKKAHRKHSIWNTKGSRNVSKHMGGMRVEEVELDEQKGKRYSVFGHYGNADKSGARPEVKHFVFGDSPEHARVLAQKHLSKKFKDYKVHKVQEGFVDEGGLQLDEEIEQLDELSKNTLKSYAAKAAMGVFKAKVDMAKKQEKWNKSSLRQHFTKRPEFTAADKAKMEKRGKGVDSATYRIIYNRLPVPESVELEEGESYDNHYYVVGTIKNKHKAVLSGPHDFSDEQLRQHFQTKGDRYYRRYHGLSRISAMKGKDLVDRGYTRTYKKYMSEGMMEIEEDRDYTIVGSHDVDGKRKTVTHTVRGISALDAARTAKREHGAKLKDYKVHQWDDDVDESDIPFLDDILAEEIDLEESVGKKSFRVRGSYEGADGSSVGVTHLVKNAHTADHAKDLTSMHLSRNSKYKNYKAESATEMDGRDLLGNIVREETDLDEGRQVAFKDLNVNDVFTHNGEKLKVQSKHIKGQNEHLSLWASKASGDGFKHTDGDYKYKNTLVKKHQDEQVTVHESVEVIGEDKTIKFKDLRPGDVFSHVDSKGRPAYHDIHGFQNHTVTYSMPTHKGYHRVDVKGARDSHIYHGSTPVILRESHVDLNESHMSEIHAEIPKVYKNNEIVHVEKGKDDEKFAVVKSKLSKTDHYHVLRYHPARGWNRLSGTVPSLNHAKQRVIANINGGDMKEETELDESAPERGGLFALVDKVSKKIVAKGSKAEMLKKKAGLTGQYILAYTYRVVGQPFSGQPVSEDFEIDNDMQLEEINEDWAKKLAAENRAKAKEDRAVAKAEAAAKAKTVKAETKAKAAFNPIKAHHLYAAIGDTYPDAEPFEALHLKFKHLGPEKVNQYANKAARAEGHKSFEHMVKSFHKQYKSDMGLHEGRKGASPTAVTGTMADAVKHLSNASQWMDSDKGAAHTAVTKAHLILKRNGIDKTKDIKAIHNSMFSGEHQTARGHITNLRQSLNK